MNPPSASAVSYLTALGLAVFLLLLATRLAFAWVEPPATLAPVPFACVDPRALDGDTLACAGEPRVRLRGVDAAERGELGWQAARDELQRWVARGRVVVVPHHRSYRRIVGDVLVGGINVGRAIGERGFHPASRPRTTLAIAGSKGLG